jgi:tripartite-type tricarboxylate transporter receptor subunit TctC
MIATAPLLLVVNPSLPVRSVRELLAYAKTNTGRFNYSAGPAGTTSHLAAELLKTMTGMDARFVSYKGGAPALIAVISGETSMMLESSTSTLSFVKDGKLRALAVTSKKRSFAIPEIPTVEEAGVPGYVFEVWYGFFVPTGTPAAVIGRLQAEVRKALAAPLVKERLAAMGTEPVGSAPEEFQKVLQVEFRKWAKLVKDAHITVE